MARSSWSIGSLPSAIGKTVVVTGANSGIGFEAALQFARKGAHTVLACRDPVKGLFAADCIRAELPNSNVEVLQLDLASLRSIRSFTKEFGMRNRKLDVLCNNAGVMALPRGLTEDGFEMQLGVNHLGHYALTGLLLDRLLAANEPRVVTVASSAHRTGVIHFDDLNWTQGYRKWRAYGQSKLANLLFTFELHRRIESHKLNLLSVACHPGYAATNLQIAGPRMEGRRGREMLFRLANRLIAQEPATGALTLLHASLSVEVTGGDYIGPRGFAQARGTPTKVTCSSAARDPVAGARLWEVSREVTGVDYPLLDEN